MWEWIELVAVSFCFGSLPLANHRSELSPSPSSDTRQAHHHRIHMSYQRASIIIKRVKTLKGDKNVESLMNTVHSIGSTSL